MTQTDTPPDGVNEDGSINGLDASFVDVDGIRTRYYDYGEGEPVVLLHGGNWSGTSSANTWSQNIRGLAEQFRVLAPDRLGCGMTDNPSEAADYVYQSEVDHMAAFTRAMGLDGFHLVGQSRGGGLAGRLAVELEGVRTVTIVDSATLAPAVGDFDFRWNPRYFDIDVDEDSPTYFEDLFRTRAENLSHSTDHITEEYVKTAAYMRRRPKARTTVEVMEDGGQLDTWTQSLERHMADTRDRIRDGELDMPVLLYWSSTDPTAIFRQGLTLYELIAQTNDDVRLLTVNRAGHNHYREYPAEFTRNVTNFVEFWG
jgi:pimeloyl-ACP methyl ester carboxylesterase